MKVEIGEYPDVGDQKVEVHIDKWDTWNMDHTLSHIVLPMLKQLKKTKHGAPNVDKEDVPRHLWPEEQDVLRYKEVGETDDNFFKRWDWVMDEMIFAFETKVGELSEWEEQFYESSELPTFESVGIGPAQLRLFPDEDGATEDYEWYEMKCSGNFKSDWDGRKKYQERISNGFRLFGKYYESLWD